MQQEGGRRRTEGSSLEMKVNAARQAKAQHAKIGQTVNSVLQSMEVVMMNVEGTDS